MNIIQVDNRAQFEQVRQSVLQQNASAEVMYDCGSEIAISEAKYKTTEFKNHLRLSDLRSTEDRFSKAVLVTTSENVELPKSEFTIEELEGNCKLEGNLFWNWLADNHETLTSRLIDDRRHFLYECGYCPETNIVKGELMSNLKLIYNHYWFKTLNGDTTTASTSESISMSEGSGDPVLRELELLTPSDNKLLLPKQELKHYSSIKRLLEKADANYKKNAFHFSADVNAADIQLKLLQGQSINIKKQYQFFPTPKKLVAKALAALELKSSHVWLEPSAGLGALAKEANKISEAGVLVELMPANAEKLRQSFGVVIEGDFLRVGEQLGIFDRIIANPPFTNDQDCTHIMKMYEHLVAGGRMVSFASQSWLNASTKKQREFKDWLKHVGAKVEKIGAGEFSSSGTNVATTMIVINK
ncbi:hypothetical protein TUMSATVNIG1_61100 (plasmid) [Vibrio nigripulchritudo]|uniref:hypothetical protein n=1 Tax=Vibrio nigripulchritudo TaxID=28173 RepID=UPI00190A6927|nr:hypothetical protein [Vibrio nigripulchritudo]BCL74126.1 hypothetical protein VNTUMSATTG_60630 [Vibrio nigripulchritudo]BDU35501.1 hypothetical protein TUMSATVNIG1_61100 [Vibrio nigripulchritudo]